MAGWTLDAFDFVLYLMAIPVLKAEFNFGTPFAGLLASVTLLSSALGGIVFGSLSDRFGRARTLMLTIAIFSACSLGSATARSAMELLIWRTLLGLGLGGEWAAGAALMSETWPPEHSPLVLLSSPLRKSTLLCVALSSSAMFGYWGLFTWLPNFLASPLEQGGAGFGLLKSITYIVPMQLGAALGYISFGFFADRFGRRFCLIAFLIGAAAMVPLYGQQKNAVLLFLLGPVLGFVGHGYFSVFGSYAHLNLFSYGSSYRLAHTRDAGTCTRLR